MTMTAAVAFAQENKWRFVDELKALLGNPSISTDPDRVEDVRRAAEFVASELKRIGMENVRRRTWTAERKGHPLVYADWFTRKGSLRCFVMGIMMFSRRSRSMSGSRRPLSRRDADGNLYARGAVDDKGQMWMHVKALESLMAAEVGSAGQCSGDC